MSEKDSISRSSYNDPLHGVKLVDILEFLVAQIGWKELGLKIKIQCFISDPSINSSLKFLRKTPWAREKVEQLYVQMIKKKIRKHEKQKAKDNNSSE